MIDLSRTRNNVLLILMGAYLLLNYGFMLVRPGGIPIGEIVLVLAMLMINHQTVLPRFLKSPLMIPFALWLTLGFGHMLLGIYSYGLWAIRDASHVIESLFLYIGFAYAGSKPALQKIDKVIPYVYLVIFLYSLSFPFRNILEPLIPTVPNMSGRETPLILYANTAMLMVIAAAYFIQRYFVEENKRFLLFAILFITTDLLLFPSRTLYLQLGFTLVYFSFSGGPQRFKKVLMIGALPLLLMAGFFASGLSVHGRFGEGFGMAGYASLFLEIFGFNSTETFSSGNAIRFDWWMQTLEGWASTWHTMLFGQGFGFPLIDFSIEGGVSVREPHNDVIGILARMGLFATLAFLMIQFYLIYLGLRVTCFYRESQVFSGLTISLLFLMINTLIMTLGESPFVMSFFTIPYYFSAGIIMRLDKLRRKISGMKKASHRRAALRQIRSAVHG